MARRLRSRLPGLLLMPAPPGLTWPDLTLSPSLPFAEWHGGWAAADAELEREPTGLLWAEGSPLAQGTGAGRAQDDNKRPSHGQEVDGGQSALGRGE